MRTVRRTVNLLPLVDVHVEQLVAAFPEKAGMTDAEKRDAVINRILATAALLDLQRMRRELDGDLAELLNGMLRNARTGQ